ncbi:hypothetical protein [Salibacterium qingdaonense]|uniref:Uncharacterized protein n=1 Tax=Salibacterium qingdaonense TaxID=266892 RepID=A0A1I4QX38_9BACI|nr:hypothetical protein [Salibacterium qingdaonense]SFM44609.1 hypothetical protein SAMN04488054_1524 [Salibacterium qingdaonense]
MFYQRWFYHPTSPWYVPLLLILSLLTATMIGAVFHITANLHQITSFMPWLLLFSIPVFVVVMEGINWENNLVHLIYAFAGERTGVENGRTLGIGLFLSYVFTYAILKFAAKLPVNFLITSTNKE